MTSPCQTCGATFEPCYCDAPIVCPGCYSVGDEPCAVGCIDDEMRREADDFSDDDYMGGFCAERGCSNYALDGYSRCATCIAERAIAKEGR